MINDLKRLALFAEVVRAGSLTAAARRLRISTSAVSQQLRALERAHGVTLLHRSTRKLSLTDAGARFAEHCETMLVAAERAEQHLTLARDAPEGELRVAAPVGFARHIAPALAPLLAAHPSLRLMVVVDDALIDLIASRIDLAFRGGRLPSSTAVARLICHFEWSICASPAYLARTTVPTTPADLLTHQWIGLPRDGQHMILDLHGPAERRETLRVEPRITSNNQYTLHQMCIAGLGLAVCVRPDIEDDLRAGRLVTVGNWRPTPGPVWAVTPQREGQPAKVRHAIEAMRNYLRTVPGVSV
jgi:DNA-binding transcriptional LysR family regulator